MSSDQDAGFKAQILDASFKLCLQTPNAGVLMAQNRLLEGTTAMYPYISNDFKTASVSKGEYGFVANNLFQGDVPSQPIVALASSEAFSGRYKRSPFNFQGFDCNYLALYVDGQSYPSQPLHSNSVGRNYVDPTDHSPPSETTSACPIRNSPEATLSSCSTSTTDSISTPNGGETVDWKSNFPMLYWRARPC